MRVRRVAAALAAALLGIGSALVGGGPATAGGWAITVLDPLPDRLKWRDSYTVGFWVLQHGTHAFWGEREDLGRVGIKLIGPQGQALSFTGVPLPEPAHYATSIHMPAPGPWRIVGVQGVFGEYEIGSVNAEGWLRMLPVPVALPENAKDWPGPIRPPRMPVDPERDPFAPIGANVADVAPSSEAAVASAAPPASDSVREGRTAVLAVVTVALLVAGVLWSAYRRRSSARAPGGRLEA